MFGEFKQFISRGNVVDMAVGVVIGGAFTPIVTAMTKVLLGFVSLLFGKPNFDHIWVIQTSDPANPILPGTIITAFINFLLVAAALFFFVVRPLNKMNARKAAKEKAEEVAPEPSEEVILLTQIRDALATKKDQL